jgi:hypothetical protein
MGKAAVSLAFFRLSAKKIRLPLVDNKKKVVF